MLDQGRSALQGERSHEFEDARPESVGGWLLYFCLVSILIGPVVSVNAILKPINLYWLTCYIALIVFSASAGD